MAGKHRTPKHKKLQAILREVRENSGLTQTGLAEKLRKPQSYVSKYESGERKLDLPEIENICMATGIELTKFIRRYRTP